jgi:hypothetical protein
VHEGAYIEVTGLKMMRLSYLAALWTSDGIESNGQEASVARCCSACAWLAPMPQAWLASTARG